LYSDIGCRLEIIEVVNEQTGKEKRHKVRLKDLERGLGIMQTKFPHIFAQVLSGDTDAPCADIFLQCVLFGEEKYA